MSTRKMIYFDYDQRKAIQAVLFLLNKHGNKIKKLQLIKLLFLADREHLLRFGRPIIGGQYYAMKLGPVCSPLLSDIDSASTQGVFPFKLSEYDVCTESNVDEEYLSESDIQVLTDIDSQFGHWDRFKLSQYTHELKAYTQNWAEGRTEGREDLSYEDFFLDSDNNVMLEIVQDQQRAWTAIDE